MAGILKVTPEKLQSTAAEFESQATTVQSYTQQMTAIVTGLTGQVWSGEAATAYTGKFNGLQDDMSKIYQMIKKQSEKLTQIAEGYKSAESTNTQASSALQSNVIG